MLHGVLRHIAAGFLPFLIFPLAIESYWISVAINFCLLGGASHFLILNALLIASPVRKRIAIDPTFYEAYGVCVLSVFAVDRTGVVWGRRVSVGESLGGGR